MRNKSYQVVYDDYVSNPLSLKQATSQAETYVSQVEIAEIRTDVVTGRAGGIIVRRTYSQNNEQLCAVELIRDQ